MELRVKGSTETFHVGIGLGKALLATGVVEEITDRDRAAEAEAKLGPTQWTWGSSKTKGRELLQASCPRCHYAVSFASDAPNALATLKQGFRHCRKAEQAPADKFDLFATAVTSAEKVRKAVKEKQDQRQRRKEEDARAGQSLLRILS